MGIRNIYKHLVSLLKAPCLANKGQAVVEFTLVFILLLVVAWIPADFGLAIYTGQIAQNASREGTRIAAADPTLGVVNNSCNWPCTGDTTIKKLVANRLSSAMMSNMVITLEREAVVMPACNAMVRVRVQGNYNYFFYQILRMFGASTPSSTPIIRETLMRWEHQCA